MTNDEPQISDALDALDTVRELKRETFDGIDDASTNLDGARREVAHAADDVGEAVSMLEEVEATLRDAKSSQYQRNDTLDAAFDQLGRPFEITEQEMGRFLDTIEAVLQSAAEGGEFDGTLTVDGTTYKVRLEEAEQPDEDEEDPDEDEDDEGDEDDGGDDLGDLFG